MDDGAGGPAAFDDARHSDADPEQVPRVGLGVAQDVGDARTDVGDDALDVVAVLGQQPVRAGQFGQREVEQLDAHAGLADVDADEQAPGGGDTQQGAGPSAVGVDDSGLFEESLRGQFGHYIADRT